MLCVERLTRGVGLTPVNAVSRVASRPAPALVLSDGKRTPYNLSTAIDPLDADALRLGGVPLRGLRHIRQPARGGDGERARCQMWPC